MENDKAVDLEYLWAQVQHVGHVKEDRRVVGQLVVFDVDAPGFRLDSFGVTKNVSPSLYQMVTADTKSGYMFWDALAMWLNYFLHNSYAHLDDVAWTVEVAQAYIEE